MKSGDESSLVNSSHQLVMNIQRFRQTFGKPSQIYKFLKEIWLTKPLYLVRNLSFVNRHRRRGTTRERSINKVCATLRARRSENGRSSISTSSLRGSQDAKRKVAENGTSSNGSGITDPGHCYYNWICDDEQRTSQLTRSSGFRCAWCERDFRSLDSLMIHLKCSHQRITFHLARDASGQMVIDMALNTSFDGSYCGFKYPGHNLRRDFRFTPSNPERRTTTTQIIYFKNKGRKPNLCLPINKLSLAPDAETFPHDDDEADVDVCSGRLYYHTSTCLPIKPNEGDIDSEADMDPDWLRERTQLMIDEFSDVNEGEKEILKLWNLHIMKNYKYKGDNHIRQACLDFVESEGHTILSRNLCKNFTLHLTNLFDFGLLSSGDIVECIRKLRKTRASHTVSPTKTSGKRTSNEHCQNSPPAKRALLSSHCNK